jgi:polyisoprenoid-binding protein YceI
MFLQGFCKQRILSGYVCHMKNAFESCRDSMSVANEAQLTRRATRARSMEFIHSSHTRNSYRFERIIFLILFASTGAMDCFGQVSKSTFEVLPSMSTLKWTGYYLFNFGEHYGSLDISEGKLIVNDREELSGFITADMRSIKDTDMPDNDGGKDLSEHLMSKDFFDVVQYPTARIEIVSSEAIPDSKPGDANSKIIANMTIKQITAPITIYALIARTAEAFKATGKFKFDRTRWGIEYNSGKVFSEVGDGAISDAIAIEFSINAKAK